VKNRQWLVHLLLVPITVLTLYPVLWVLKMALNPEQSFALSANPLPTVWSIQNFADVLTARDSVGHYLFARQALNSVIVAAAVTVVGLALSTTAAWSLSRYRFPGREATLRGFLLTQMFPGVVTSIPLYVLLDNLHLLNHLMGLVLVYATTSIPFCTFMLKAYFDTLPRELEEAVLLDGGTRWDVFFRIALPLSRPALTVTALFAFLASWNEFILAATFMTDPKAFTLPVRLHSYVNDYSTEWGHFAAGAVLVSLPVMALFLALERHLIGGLTDGAVKG